MKKILLITTCLLFTWLSSFAEGKKTIYFATVVDKEMPTHNPYPKAPIQPPCVYIDKHDIYFQASHPEFVLNILVDDEIVYTCIVNTNVTTLELPSFLLGEYKIQLIAEPYCFIGYITL